LRKSWFAAQLARFTEIGADSGAAALPPLRRARFPGTVGPDAGKRFALADDVIAASTAALIRIFELKGSTERFRSVSYAMRRALEKKKMRRTAFFYDLSRPRSRYLARNLMFYKMIPVRSSFHRYFRRRRRHRSSMI